jgi:hypothetical protein
MVFDEFVDPRIFPHGLRFESSKQAFDGRLFQQLCRLNWLSEFFRTHVFTMTESSFSA